MRKILLLLCLTIGIVNGQTLRSIGWPTGISTGDTAIKVYADSIFVNTGTKAGPHWTKLTRLADSTVAFVTPRQLTTGTLDPIFKSVTATVGVSVGTSRRSMMTGWGQSVDALSMVTDAIADITEVGGTGSSTWGYAIVPVSASGVRGDLADANYTAIGVAWNLISQTQYNRVDWHGVSGAASYDVYRLLVPTGGTVGFLATVADTTFNDTGYVATGSVPTSLFVIGNGGSYNSTSGTPPVDPLPFESNGLVNGQYNTFLGLGAGMHNTTGSHNTFIGRNAGLNNTNGDQNTFIGINAGIANTSGYHNVFIGGTQRRNTTSYYNTYVGIDCGLQTAGNNNVAVGTSAFDAANASMDVSVGVSAGANDLGGNNVFLGYNAGNRNTSGTYSLMAGSGAGAYDSTGTNNVLLGGSAGFYAGSASKCVMVGFAAGLYNTQGYQTFLGYKSGYYNTTGQNNTYVGFQSGENNVTSSNNTMVGYLTGQKNLTGNNSGFGYSALVNCTSGSENCAFGVSALMADTSGGSNCAYGSLSLASLTSGSRNIALGYQAGGYTQNGTTTIKAANRSIFIGTSTKALTDTDVNETVIGDTATGSGSNSVTLGNKAVTVTKLRGLVTVGNNGGTAIIGANDSIQVTVSGISASAVIVLTYAGAPAVDTQLYTANVQANKFTIKTKATGNSGVSVNWAVITP